MKSIVIIAALLGFSSVVMGAAGDHLLEANMAADLAERYAVALRYHQLYSVVLLALGFYGFQATRGKLYLMTCAIFIAGTIVFSGSLYLSTFLNLPALTYGTPCGGGLLNQRA